MLTIEKKKNHKTVILAETSQRMGKCSLVVLKLSPGLIVSMLSITSCQGRQRFFLHIFSGCSDISAWGKFLEKHLEQPQVFLYTWLNLKVRSERMYSSWQFKKNRCLFSLFVPWTQKRGLWFNPEKWDTFSVVLEGWSYVWEVTILH